MFRMLIKETVNGVAKEPLLDLRIQTERFQQIIGRYLLKYKNVKESYNNNGYKELEFFCWKDKEFCSAIISFWRLTKDGGKVLEEAPETKAIVTLPPKPEPPMDPRLKEMLDDGVLTKSNY